MTTDRQRVASGSPYEPEIGFSRALRVGNRVLVAGTAPVWPDGEVDPDPYVQARRCLEIIVAARAEAGAKPEHVVRTRTFLTDPGDWERSAGARRGLSRRAASHDDVVAAGCSTRAGRSD